MQQQRFLIQLGLGNFQFASFPTVFWDVYGQHGHPVRTTVSEMGPLLLSRLLNLNEIQSGVLQLVFKIADDNGLLLLDLKDLRAMTGDPALFFCDDVVASLSKRGNFLLESLQDQFIRAGDEQACSSRGFFLRRKQNRRVVRSCLSDRQVRHADLYSESDASLPDGSDLKGAKQPSSSLGRMTLASLT